MVIFQTQDGNPGYNQFDTVDQSVAFVEKLRNEQNVQNARIFKLEELKFEFKPYYKVQIGMLNAGAPLAAAPAAPVPSAAPAAGTSPFGGTAPAAPAPAAAPPAPTGAPASFQPPEPSAPQARPDSLADSADAGSAAPNGSSFSGAGTDEERGRRGLFGR